MRALVASFLFVLMMSFSTGHAQTLSQDEITAFKAKIMQNWKPPAGNNGQGMEVRIRLNRDGTLNGPPTVPMTGSDPAFLALRDSAIRAAAQSAPYTMFRQETYEAWKDIILTLDPRSVPAEFVCTMPTGNDFWYQTTLNTKDVSQFADDAATVRFLDAVRKRGLAFCAGEHAAGRCCGPSAYPRGVKITVISDNIVQLIANGDVVGGWTWESLPKKKMMAAFEVQRKQEESRLHQLAAEEARREFALGIGDPIAGVWKSQNTTLTIRREGSLYSVHSESRNGAYNGDFAGPYKDSQIQLGGVFGNISVLASSAELVFAGEKFSRISK